MKFISLVLIIVCISNYCIASHSFDAIVLLDSTSFVFKNNARVVEYNKKRIKILNKKSKPLSYLEIKFNSSLHIILNIEGRILDENNNVIKKIKKKQIVLSKIYSESFVDDIEMFAFYNAVVDYPTIIEWEYSMEYDSFFLHDWSPVYYNNTKIDNSYLVLKSENQNFINYKAYNVTDSVSFQLDNMYVKGWNVKNVIIPDGFQFVQSIHSFFPYIYLSATNYKFKDIIIDNSSWVGFGNFIDSLNSGKNILSDESKMQIKNLISDELTKIQKVQILYEYMLKNTRYVSIQLGVGGWIPLSAEYVHKNKYGDCKALVNYLHSILDVVGITSYYTLVNAGEQSKYIIPDLPKNYFNHVILCVPIDKDTIWLECTNPFQPFNFLGDFTSNRYGLLIQKDSSKLVRTQSYGLENNYEKIRLIISNIDKETIKIKTTKEVSGNNYLNYVILNQYSIDEQKEIINKTIFNTSFQEINNFKIDNSNNVKYPISSITSNYEINNTKFIIDNFFIIPIIEFSYKMPYYYMENLQIPIENNNDFQIIKEYFIEIPINYSINYIPSNIQVETQWGDYFFENSYKENMLYIKSQIIFRSFNIEPKDFNDFNNFIKNIDKYQNNQIILQKI